MKVLLDESVPKDLGSLLKDHIVHTVAKMGWAGIKNGELLKLAAKQFDVFITADRNIEYQQNWSSVEIAVIVLVAINNRIQSLEPLVPQILQALPGVQRGRLVKIGKIPNL